MKPKSKEVTNWTFLSNHSHVLLCLAKDPEIRLRDIADLVGITERAVHRIIMDLEESNYISKSKVGRRNLYTINSSKPLRHPIESHHTIKTLITMVKS